MLSNLNLIIMKKSTSSLFVLLILISSTLGAREYHVAVNGNDKNDGSSATPLKTINYASQIAQPGDVITVHAVNGSILPGEVKAMRKELFTRQLLVKKYLLKDRK
jgi:hypothetical protein